MLLSKVQAMNKGLFNPDFQPGQNH
jgi:hypothetical protein